MEKRFESLSIFEFHKLFPDDDSCYLYLEKLKWNNGYQCIKCKNTKYHTGQGKLGRKCSLCNHQESVTSNTLFHKVKFPIVKAFYIIYYMSTSKKGISSTELSRKLQLRQKTCWLFKRKVMEAMASSGRYPLMGDVEIDETLVGGKEKKVIGREHGKKKLVVFAIEKSGNGVKRAYGKVIQNAGTKELEPFVKAVVHPDSQITTDKWRGYRPLKKEFKKLKQKKSKQGKNFDPLHRYIMGFKGWLRGIHHSVDHLQAYINEYNYRYNRHFMNGDIFENLMVRMVEHKPAFYKMLKVS